MWRGEFLSSDEGKRLLLTIRRQRRLYLDVLGVEPRGKTMRSNERLRFQSAVLRQLRERRRRAYRGPLVLRLRIKTTSETPGHIHTLTKNFLDLLGPQLSPSPSPRALLYHDDSQIHGLTVTCTHGADKAEIQITARSLGDFREDLSIAMECEHATHRRQTHYGSGGDSLGSLTLHREAYIHRIGERAYNYLLAIEQRAAQLNILGHSGLRARDLAFFYRAIDLRFGRNAKFLEDLGRSWEESFFDSPFRIKLDQLPTKVGSSSSYREHIDAAVTEFHERYFRFLSPVRIPLALEVVIKPPIDRLARSAHDLDNVMRKYLIPKIVEVFQPPSSFLWAINREEIGAVDRELGTAWQNDVGRVPKSTAIGLVRLDAWRIPRAEGDHSPGFVAINLVADEFGFADSLGDVDNAVENWADRH